MSGPMERREFLRLGAGVAGVVAGGGWTAVALAQVDQTSDGPYGPLLPPDPNGIMLPEGFTARELARAGQAVGAQGYVWHGFPDGGATFGGRRGGWVYTSNSELPGGSGGVGALRFDRAGEVVDAYSICAGTSTNCAGGGTPWGTWLSCEEHSTGQVWECDPSGQKPAQPRPAMGAFSHEAAAVDPRRRQVYLTEDQPDGRLYRFIPARFPRLDAGALEVATVDGAGAVTWQAVPDPSGVSAPTRQQVPTSTPFNGGEGVWYHRNTVWFTTKGDNKVWAYDVKRETLVTLYDPVLFPEPPLTGVDNLTLTPAGDVLVAEDHPGEQELVLITTDGVVAPLLRVTNQPASELAGPAFSPDGSRLYVSSQRGGTGGGVTYEVRGPFERAKSKGTRKKDNENARAASTRSLAAGVLPGLVPGPGTALLVAAAVAAWQVRTRPVAGNASGQGSEHGRV